MLLYGGGMPLWWLVFAGRCWRHRRTHVAAERTLTRCNGADWTRRFLIVVFGFRLLRGSLAWPVAIPATLWRWRRPIIIQADHRCGLLHVVMD